MLTSDIVGDWFIGDMLDEPVLVFAKSKKETSMCRKQLWFWKDLISGPQIGYCSLPKDHTGRCYP